MAKKIVTWVIACEQCDEETDPEATRDHAEAAARDDGFVHLDGDRWLCGGCAEDEEDEESRTFVLHEDLRRQYALSESELETLLGDDETAIAAMVRERPILKHALEDIQAAIDG